MGIKLNAGVLLRDDTDHALREIAGIGVHITSREQLRVDGVILNGYLIHLHQGIFLEVEIGWHHRRLRVGGIFTLNEQIVYFR